MLQLILPILIVQALLGLGTPVDVPTKTLATHEISLEDRYSVPAVNQVFKDNILLTLDYATGMKVTPPDVNWSAVEKPFTKDITLEPGQTFAFHDDVLPEFAGKINQTTNAHFNAQEGFKSDGYLMGDGVCHLASLMYWVAKDAGLAAVAPTRHDFAPVPDIPAEFGVSIYDNNLSKDSSNQSQNLYITNNKEKTVTFEFVYDGKTLTATAEEKI